jgi:hypothetical protein
MKKSRIYCRQCDIVLSKFLNEIDKINIQNMVLSEEKILNYFIQKGRKISKEDLYLYAEINCVSCQITFGELIFSAGEKLKDFIGSCLISVDCVYLKEFHSDDEMEIDPSEESSMKIIDEVILLQQEGMKHSKILKENQKKFFDLVKKNLDFALKIKEKVISFEENFANILINNS